MKHLLLILLFPLSILAQKPVWDSDLKKYVVDETAPLITYVNTIYIDSAAAGGGDGSIDSPFNEIADISWTSNTQYLFKRGYQYEGGSLFVIDNKDSLRIGGYGVGANPRFLANGHAGILTLLRSEAIIVDSIDLYAIPYDGTTDGSLRLNGHSSSGQRVTQNLYIRGCLIYGGYDGIRIDAQANYIRNVYIIDCLITDTEEDGVFGLAPLPGDSGPVYFIRTTITRVNLDCIYTPPCGSNAAGDCIHFVDDWGDIIVIDCIIDHRFTGMKGTFIYNTTGDGFPDNGLYIYHTTFYPAKDTTDAESASGTFIMGHQGLLDIYGCKWIGGVENNEYADQVYGVGGTSSCDTIRIRNTIIHKIYNFSTGPGTVHIEITNVSGTVQDEGLYWFAFQYGDPAYIKNTVFAYPEGVSMWNGITNDFDSCYIYEGSAATWDNHIGWQRYDNVDYELTSDSRLIDMGMTGLLEYDIDGNPADGIRDIGAYEYVNETPQRTGVYKYGDKLILK